jgi:hypothetical protein
MFPTIPASTGAHHAEEKNSKLPATKSVKAKKISVRLLPNLSAMKLTMNVYSPLLRTVAARTIPISKASKPSRDK